MVAAFATVEDLRTFTGNPQLDTARGQLVLDVVSAAIRAELGWAVTQETGVTLTLDGNGEPHLLLPTRRLAAVSAVAEDAVARTAGRDYTWHENGLLTRIAGHPCRPVAWTCTPRGVTVTITHGYPAGQVPEVFTSVALERAADMLANPDRLRSETIGQVSLTYAEASNPETGGDPRLDRYRLEASQW